MLRVAARRGLRRSSRLSVFGSGQTTLHERLKSLRASWRWVRRTKRTVARACFGDGDERRIQARKYDSGVGREVVRAWAGGLPG